jgi:hypothetical protein
MHFGLSYESILEDVAVKQCHQTLCRFLNKKRKLSDKPLIDFNTSIMGLTFEEKEKKCKKKYPSFPIRHSKRKVKTPKKLLWEEW